MDNPLTEIQPKETSAEVYILTCIKKVCFNKSAVVRIKVGNRDKAGGIYSTLIHKYSKEKSTIYCSSS